MILPFDRKYSHAIYRPQYSHIFIRVLYTLSFSMLDNTWMHLLFILKHLKTCVHISSLRRDISIQKTNLRFVILWPTIFLANCYVKTIGAFMALTGKSLTQDLIKKFPFRINYGSIKENRSGAFVFKWNLGRKNVIKQSLRSRDLRSIVHNSQYNVKVQAVLL